MYNGIQPALRTLIVLIFACVSGFATTTIAQAPADNSIDSVDVTAQTGGSVVVRIGLKVPLTSVPAAFAIENPPRIAFDLMGVANATGKARQDVNDGDLKSVNLVQTTRSDASRPQPQPSGRLRHAH